MTPHSAPASAGNRPSDGDNCKLFEIYLKRFDILSQISKDNAANITKDQP